MTLTKPQRKSLHGKWLQDSQGMSYRDFRRTVHPELGSYECFLELRQTDASQLIVLQRKKYY